VAKIDKENGRVFVHYLYWGPDFDEWINDVPNRVAPIHEHTYVQVWSC